MADHALAGRPSSPTSRNLIMPALSLDLSQLLVNGNSPSPQPSRPPMVVQRLGLLERFAAARAHDRLEPGDLVVAKPGLGLLNDNLDDTHALLVWRRLDPSEPLDLSLILESLKMNQSDPADMVVLLPSFCGASYFAMAVPSRHYRRLDSVERAEVEALLAMDGPEATDGAALQGRVQDGVRP